MVGMKLIYILAWDSKLHTKSWKKREEKNIDIMQMCVSRMSKKYVKSIKLVCCLYTQMNTRRRRHRRRCHHHSIRNR